MVTALNDVLLTALDSSDRRHLTVCSGRRTNRRLRGERLHVVSATKIATYATVTMTKALVVNVSVTSMCLRLGGRVPFFL